MVRIGVREFKRYALRRLYSTKELHKVDSYVLVYSKHCLWIYHIFKEGESSYGRMPARGFKWVQCSWMSHDLSRRQAPHVPTGPRHTLTEHILDAGHKWVRRRRELRFFWGHKRPFFRGGPITDADINGRSVGMFDPAGGHNCGPTSGNRPHLPQRVGVGIAEMPIVWNSTSVTYSRFRHIFSLLSYDVMRF